MKQEIIAQLKREDFDKKVNAEGYQILYKGKYIGGAGILGKYKGRNKAAQMNDYAEMAAREIGGILKGDGPAHMIEAIEEINKEHPQSQDESQKELFTGGRWRWEWDSDPLHTGIDILSDNGEMIVDFVMGKNLEEAKANAALIAASKDMYKLIQWISRVTNNPEIGIKCDAMIKKATPNK